MGIKLEVYPRLYVGDGDLWEAWKRVLPMAPVVHAAKEPYHRNAVGYKSPGAPKNHPEYLVARRGHELFLNLIDADKTEYIPEPLIDAALEFIHAHLKTSRVLVHCNWGRSRAPAIAFLYLDRHTDHFKGMSYPQAVKVFRKLYPEYIPAPGIEGYVRAHYKGGNGK